MSLSSHLANPDSPVRGFLRQTFPLVSTAAAGARCELANLSPILPDGPVAWSTVGTALDYRLRYYFAQPPLSELVAWKGARLCAGKPVASRDRIFAPRRARLHEEFVNRSLTVLADMLADVRPVGRRLDTVAEAQIARCCYVLAWFDEVFRAGTEINSPLFSIQSSDPSALLDLVPDVAVCDLRRLSWGFYDHFAHLLARPTTLNPTFSSSYMVGGADADLIVDACLIDIKTTKLNRVDTTWFYQLLGYVLLDDRNEYAIENVAIYMSRHCTLLKWDVDALISIAADATHDLSELRRAFRQALQLPLLATPHSPTPATV